MTGADASKAHALRQNLSAGVTLITLDARSPGVSVPASLSWDRALVLRLGYDLTPPIHDLTVGDREFSATLSFSGTAFLCRVPYHALYRVSGSASDAVWTADVPVDGVDNKRAPEPAKVVEPEPAKVVEPKRPVKDRSHLRLVP